MENIEQIATGVIDQGYKITPSEAGALLDADLSKLLAGADSIRGHFRANEVKLCSIVNARSGDCSEDCKFCAQSAHNSAKIRKIPSGRF